MDFGKAIESLKEGKKVARKDWGGYWSIEKIVFKKKVNHSVHAEIIMATLKDGGYAPAQPYQADILAEDWEIVE